MIKLEKASYYIMLAVIFLAPLAFLSPTLLSLEYTKAAIFSIGTILALLGVAVHTFGTKKIIYPKGSLLYVSVAIVVSFIASVLANVSTAGLYRTVFGDGVESTTLWFVLLALAFVYSLTVVLRNKERVFSALTVLVLSGIILGLYHVARLFFGAGFLSFGGLFSIMTSNTIGQWNDVGVYFGFTLLLSYLAIEFMVLTKNVRILLYVLAGLSLIMVVSVGFVSVWYVLLGLSILLFIYIKKHYQRISYPTIILGACALILTAFGGPISAKIAATTGINQLDVRPSWELSLELIGNTLNKSPLFGAGPNRFVHEYLLNKPAPINQTIFWAIDFTSGVSYLISFAVTLGGFGILVIAFALAVFVYLLSKAYRHTIAEPIDRFIIVAGASTITYFVILSVLYNPSYPILIIGLTALGLFVVGLRDIGVVKFASLEATTSRTALLVKIIAVIATVILILACVFALRRTIAALYFQKAIRAATAADLPKAEEYIRKALEKSRQPNYNVALSEVMVSKVGQVLSTATSIDKKTADSLKIVLDEGIESAQAAITLDPLDYKNYIAQARVYESVIPAQVSGAYDNAMRSYASASALNPGNPSIFLSAAQLEVAMRKPVEAKTFIGKALQVKNNYSDAVFLLSQIQVAENSTKDAINTLLYLLQINPENPVVYFQLGLLYYNINDNANTILALNKAIELSPEYSNARYFLGLALARQGKYADAANQFAEILKYNEGNTEVAEILTTLRAGRSPFPVVTSPEKSKNPPVKDSIDKKTSTKVKTR